MSKNQANEQSIILLKYFNLVNVFLRRSTSDPKLKVPNYYNFDKKISLKKFGPVRVIQDLTALQLVKIWPMKRWHV